jgi:hypothetical protein
LNWWPLDLSVAWKGDAAIPRASPGRHDAFFHAGVQVFGSGALKENARIGFASMNKSTECINAHLFSFTDCTPHKQQVK